MKKLLIALPLIAGVSWAGTSYYTGVQSESTYHQLLEQLNGLTPLKFEEESYTSGLTNSRAITRVKASTADDAEIIIRLQHDISHSPVRVDEEGAQIGNAAIRTTWLVEDADSDEVKKIRERFKGKEPFELKTVASINRTLNNTLSIAAFESRDDAATITIDPSSFDFTTEADRTVGEGTFGKLSMVGAKNEDIAMSASTLKIDVTHGDVMSMGYTMDWLADSIRLKNQEVPGAITLQKLGITADGIARDDKIDYSGIVKVGNIDMASTIPAEKMPVQSASIEFATKNIDLKALENYVKTVKELSLSDQMLLDASDEKVDERFLESLKAIITRDITVDANIYAKNSGGEGKLESEVSFVGDDSASGYDNIVTVADLFGALEMNIDAFFDKSALNLTPLAPMLQGPQAAFFFADNGDNVSSKVSYKDLVVDINGAKIPLANLMGITLEMPLSAMLQ